jgi:hypothetical protein
MHLTWRGGIATLFVGAGAVVYVLWLSGTVAPDMSARTLGAILFGLGWAACVTNQNQMASVYGVGGRRRAPMAYVVIASGIGAGALVAGVIAVVTGNEAMLATLVVAILALWAMSTVRHMIAIHANDVQVLPEPLDRAIRGAASESDSAASPDARPNAA